MKVDKMIELLQKEHPDEEVYVAFEDDRHNYMKIIERPIFLHAGPKTFIDDDGIEQTRSVVIMTVQRPK
jgi:hypothetical protein